ncbi:peptidyl-prolyl cis-trans isomerase [Thalassotalea sp. M1531]|uniref:Peptidyl-prolyl cis-trans isomerase n=1 Tax=Thalassotalea algicola TaxID=2716224 RepID=A0A7Y0Q8H9_9GAMM|nr:peptidylprolyl isomerase [Thalassotalea algicola]NMP32180.1 peptidyl-prolyl cis-trans isomerase [Thalassotalea algicola]
MRSLFFALMLLTGFNVQAKNSIIDPDNLFPKVKIETSMGIIIVELNRIKAPLTVNNFLTYVVEGEFNNTIFHRVLENYIVQGGGYDKDFTHLKTHPDIVNESGNGLKNDEGTIAMAKESRPHTANRQFFFNLADNTNLNPGRQWGYTVFGEIVEGFEVIEAMGMVKTEYSDVMGWDDVPVEPITLIKATLLPAE